MPELPEVEAYRALAETRALQRPIAAVVAGDAWFLKGGIDAAAVRAALVDRRFTSARRRGKLLLLEVDAGDAPTLGLRFGMTGSLVVDDAAGVDALLYTSNWNEPRWDRFSVSFADGGHLRVRDPRRLGGVLLDPAEESLGPDAAGISAPALRSTAGEEPFAGRFRL